MFYKFENGNWDKANEVHFPNGLKLTIQNKEEVDGWKWYDIQPYNDEVIDSMQPQNNIKIN